MIRLLPILLIFTFLTTSLLAQSRVQVTDATLMGGQDYTWTSDNVYELSGYVYLETGSTLTIEPGTRIEGLPASAADNRPASALIITRGAQIFAEGTSNNPIVFTSTEDDGFLDPVDGRGGWGGLIILGSATVGEENGTGQANIEGIVQESRTLFGGNNDEDNSGKVRYVSIRYGGAELIADSEINGLTLGGVGRGTEIEYVEVFANSDDGIEIFGGTVDIKYAVVAFCGDDSVDTDYNWGGRGQFLFAIQFPQDPTSNQQNGGEHDGSEDPSQAGGRLQEFYNATYIGMGQNSDDGNGNNALRIKENGAISYSNSIFTEFGKDGLRLSGNSAARYLAQDFDLRNNIWWNFGDGNDPAAFVRIDDAAPATVTSVLNRLISQEQTVASPLLNGISRTTNGMLDPRPGVGSPALTGLAEYPEEDDFFEEVSYRGAFSFGTNWALGWTNLDEQGYFGDLIADRPVRVITDASLVGNTEYSWSADTIYRLSGYVYVEAGSCLNIPAGTRIEGLPASAIDNRPSSALIITRGAQIKAIGTESDPIVFTGVDVDEDVFGVADARGSWGGLILLGNATVGDRDGAGVANIEGIPSEARTLYGGNDDDDNSGIIRYVSILYGGDELIADSEINGLTLGGVGRGTEIEYVEVYGNADDGIEFFGGTVDIKHAAVIFCGDDSFDTDNNWGGRGQFLFTMFLNNDPSTNTQNGGEHDGSPNPVQAGGRLQQFFNTTYIGMGAAEMDDANNGINIKENGAATYGNAIFTEFGRDGLRLANNSAARYLASDFTLTNNLWWNFGDGNTPTEFVRVDDATNAVVQQVLTLLVAQDQTIDDPELFRINWDNASEDNGEDGNGTDPRPVSGSPANFSDLDAPDDGFFDSAPYFGAFDPFENDAYWLRFTHAFRLGVIVDARPLTVGTADFGQAANGLKIGVPAPNPASYYTNLTFNLPFASGVNALSVFDQTGRLISKENIGQMVAGETTLRYDVDGLKSGLYYLILDTQAGVVAQRLTVAR